MDIVAKFDAKHVLSGSKEAVSVSTSLDENVNTSRWLAICSWSMGNTASPWWAG
jgi:hypothetical protein